MSTLIEYGGNSGVFVKNYGSLSTDYTGLSSASAEFMTKRENWAALPKILAPHPIFKFLGMTHSDVDLDEAWAIMRAEYKGALIPGGDGFTSPVYELCVGLTEEPIETHPDFVSKIAGNPTNPKNGAMFRNLRNPNSIATAASKATTNSGWVFIGFEISADRGSTKNPFYGIERYLDVGNITWRERRHGRRGTRAISEAGTVQNPRGPAPNLPARRNWMNMGTTSTDEGSATSFSTEWRASGPNGWNKTIYR